MSRCPSSRRHEIRIDDSADHARDREGLDGVPSRERGVNSSSLKKGYEVIGRGLIATVRLRVEGGGGPASPARAPPGTCGERPAPPRRSGCAAQGAARRPPGAGGPGHARCRCGRLYGRIQAADLGLKVNADRTLADVGGLP